MENKCDHAKQANSCRPKGRVDWLLWGSISVCVLSYALYISGIALPEAVHTFAHAQYDLLNRMWWGVLLGIVFVGLLEQVPREMVMAVLGHKKGFSGIVRATLAGVALDLCSHGILLVGMKLHERGASLGQTMAFLIASPWNSLSLTLILWALIGWEWMLTFLLLSLVIAIISGLIFETLVDKKILPENPNRLDFPKQYNFKKEVKMRFKRSHFNGAFFTQVTKDGFKDSGMVLRWVFFGVVLAGLIRTFVDADTFSSVFGPTMLGLGATLIAATIIEVCSEGSTPIAADILTRAHAPGNSFAFLMTGVSTDYTEIMVLKDTMKSWKIALFLPLVTVPQVVVLGAILNWV